MTFSGKYKAAAAVSALSITVGVFGAAAPALVSTSTASPTVTTTSTSTTQRVGAGQSSLDSGRIVIRTGAASPDVLLTDVQKKGGVKPIVDWLKKNAPKAYAGLKKAASKGRSYVNDWFYDLPKWMQKTILILWGSSWPALLTELIKYLT